MATAAELEAKVRQQYPQFAFLLNNPELRKILLDAVDPSKGFSAQEFEARIQQTNWWKSNGDSFRSWEALVNTNPGEAKRQVAGRVAEITDLIGQLGGVSLTASQRSYVADFTLRYGIQSGSAEMREMIAALIPTGPAAKTPLGTFQATLAEVKRLAKHDYLVPVSDEQAWKWARDLTAGNLSMEGLAAHFGNIAKGRFSHMADEIDQGITPGMMFDPYRQMMATELEVPPESIDLMEAKWSEVLSHNDAGKIRAMTMGEANKFVRSQAEWAETTRAKQMGAEMASSLLRTFGAKA
jgi:hypothetical protein